MNKNYNNNNKYIQYIMKYIKCLSQSKMSRWKNTNVGHYELCCHVITVFHKWIPRMFVTNSASISLIAISIWAHVIALYYKIVVPKKTQNVPRNSANTEATRRKLNLHIRKAIDSLLMVIFKWMSLSFWAKSQVHHLCDHMIARQILLTAAFRVYYKNEWKINQPQHKIGWRWLAICSGLLNNSERVIFRQVKQSITIQSIHSLWHVNTQLPCSFFFLGQW